MGSSVDSLDQIVADLQTVDPSLPYPVVAAVVAAAEFAVVVVVAVESDVAEFVVDFEMGSLTGAWRRVVLGVFVDDAAWVGRALVWHCCLI